MKIFVYLLLLSLLICGCNEMKDIQDNYPKKYNVSKSNYEPNIDSNWEKPLWDSVLEQNLGYFMGEKPEHFPNVSFKITYNDDGIIVIFEAQDQYIRAVTEEPFHGPVYGDSCVDLALLPQ